jgi:hypothetical protein
MEKLFEGKKGEIGNMAAVTVSKPTYLSSWAEHAFVFYRSNGDQVNFSVEHTAPFGPIPLDVAIPTGDPKQPYEFDTVQFGLDTPLYELSLVIFDNDPDEPNKREEINLTYAEARLLRDLLNRPEVGHILETN